MIIFLDIDGVLNQLQGNYYIDKNCVEQLGILCKQLGGKIVLTSSWRLGYSNVGKCSPQIEELKTVFKEYGITIEGRTFDLGDRYTEIKDYIIRRGVGKYVVIDDDSREFSSKELKNLFFVSPRKGITSKDVDRILHNLGN